MSRAIAVALSLLSVGLAGCQPTTKPPVLPPPAQPTQLEVKAAQLYAGLEAHRALPQGDTVVLDTRNWSAGEFPGRLTSDVIDLGGEAVLSEPVKIYGVTTKTSVVEPADSKVVTLIRHRATYFDPALSGLVVTARPAIDNAPLSADGWSPWQSLSDFSSPAETRTQRSLDLGQNRYVQIRVELSSSSPKIVPAVKTVTLNFNRQSAARFRAPLELVNQKVHRIVRSPVEFGYERMDQKDMVWLRTSCDLDKVVAGGRTEMEKLIALMDWVSRRRNVRGEEGNKHLGGGDPYPWNLYRIFDLESGGTVYGHCGSYSQLLITAATALGWHARHVAVEGYRCFSHEVVEIWVGELGKWVYFDPSLGTYYTDRAGTPLNLMEMHDIFVNFYVEPGKTLKDYLPRVEEVAKDKGWQHRQTLNFMNLPVVCRTNNYTYGEHKPWDWTEAQGVMTAGFLQMTPRNNFNSQPEPAHPRYCDSPDGRNGFPYYTDARTPLWHDEAEGQKDSSVLTRSWVTRQRDFNWTLNQASLRLVRTGEDQIAVEPGNSQPFFRKYVIQADGKPYTILVNKQPQAVTSSPFTWKLTLGRHTLTVNCMDEFGQLGLPSTVTVELKE